MRRVVRRRHLGAHVVPMSSEREVNNLCRKLSSTISFRLYGSHDLGSCRFHGLIKPAAVIDAMYSRKCGSKCTAVLMYCRLSGGASFLRLMSNSRSSGSSLCFTIGV